MTKLSSETQSIISGIVMEECECRDCNNERYILHGCCDGRECGCMGQPFAVSVCKYCNADGKKEMGEYTESYAQYVEFIET